MYAIMRNEDGKFVSFNAENGASYTDKLQHARIWETWDAASRHKCGNETILNVATLLRDHIVSDNNR